MKYSPRFWKDWRNQVTTKMDIVTMVSGTSHEEVLAGCIKQIGRHN